MNSLWLINVERKVYLLYRTLHAHLFVYIDDKMAVVVDLTKQNVFATFEGSAEDDISYATNFWQSIQLHPPMESRLVSSDIKQRLKVAPPSSQGNVNNLTRYVDKRAWTIKLNVTEYWFRRCKCHRLFQYLFTSVLVCVMCKEFALFLLHMQLYFLGTDPCPTINIPV